ncbi:GAF domain-containing protein [Ditylenchus destructor]|nr:GAF domain-containing protein [Ditylenchus destructor]
MKGARSDLDCGPADSDPMSRTRVDPPSAARPPIVPCRIGQVQGVVLRSDRERSMPSREALLRIIEIHSQVAQLGLDLAGVMSLSVHGTLDLVEADGAAIELAEGEDLVYRAVAGAASHQLGVRVRRDGSLSGRCLREAQALICTDTETDPRVDLEACRRVGLRSMVVLPLLHQGAPVGCSSPSPAARPVSDRTRSRCWR